MARLNQPAGSSHVTSLADRTSDTVTDTASAISSPVLRPLPLEASLQSHGNANLPLLLPRCGFGLSLLSPADCRTLNKILRDASHSSPPATPSPLEPGEQLFANSDRMSNTIEGDAEDDESYHLIDDEATDTGYEDENGSMELSEGVEAAITDDILTQPGESTSPSVSYSERRLQDRVLTHIDKDRLRYTGRRSSLGASGKSVRFKRREQECNDPVEATQGDAIEDVMNLSSKLAPPARLQYLHRGYMIRQPTPKDIKQQNRIRLSLESILQGERVEQEHSEHDEAPGVFIPPMISPEAMMQTVIANGHTVYHLSVEEERRKRREHKEASHHKAPAVRGQQSVESSSDADKKDGATTDDAAEVQDIKNTQADIPASEGQVGQAVPSSQANEYSTLLVLNTPPPAPQASIRDHIRFTTNQNVPDTPFTKTLGYFRQYKGAQNSPSKRRRNTALPQDIAEVAMVAVYAEDKASLSYRKGPQPVTSGFENTDAASTKAAVADLEDKAPSEGSEYTNGIDGHGRAPATIDATIGQAPDKGEAVRESAADDTQKQLVFYPQHPAFINAIAMIPATMFWATAAPVVKYANIAIDLLIDKLRDTYL